MNFGEKDQLLIKNAKNFVYGTIKILIIYC